MTLIERRVALQNKYRRVIVLTNWVNSLERANSKEGSDMAKTRVKHWFRIIIILLLLLPLVPLSFKEREVAAAAPESKPRATATNVTVGSGGTAVGGTVTTNVTVNGYSGLNLGAWELRINFDKTKVNVTAVAGGDGNFASAPYVQGGVAAANSLGQLTFNNFAASGQPGPTIRVAAITWRAFVEGTATLTLTITRLADRDGADVTGPVAVNGTVTVMPLPVADFTASPTLVTAPPYTVNFTDASTGMPTSWSWNFGDGASGAGNASTAQNPSHTFSGPGRYTVALTASNAVGSNTMIKNEYIKVYTTPAPNFVLSLNPPSGIITGGKVTTTMDASASWGPVDRYVVDWGDGSTQTTVDYPNPVISITHDYTRAGTYPVTLKVINPAAPAGITSAQTILRVYPASLVTVQLRGAGDGDRLILNPGTSGNIELWAKNIPDLGARSGIGAYDFRIDFDKTSLRINSVSGGQTPFQESPQNNAPPGDANTTGQLFINAYQTASDPKGSLKLAVINVSALALEVHTLNLQINSLLTASVSPITADPVGIAVIVQIPQWTEFTALPTVLTSPPYTAYFTDNSLGSRNFFTWNFGDPASGANNTSLLQNPIHNFSGPGRYNVSLATNNLVGSPHTITKNEYITVYTAPVPVFNISRNPSTGVITAGKVTVTVDASASTGAVDSWVVFWGDGSPDTAVSYPASASAISHDYTAAGNYQVRLKVVNPNSPAGVTSAPQTARIYTIPAPAFALGLNPSSGILSSPVAATVDASASTGNMDSYEVSWGDGAPNTVINYPNPVTAIIHNYNAAGNWNITLKVVNPAAPQGVTSAPQIARVYATPVASFNLPPRGNLGVPIAFADTSSGSAAAWAWNFGDPGSGSSNISTLQNPTHIYTSEGTYTVGLTVTNPVSSSNTSRTIQVLNNTAVLKLTQSTNPTSKVVSLRVGVQRVRNPVTDATVAVTEGFSAFDMSLSYQSAGVTMYGGIPEAPFGSLTINTNADGGTKTFFNAFEASASVQPGADGQTPAYFAGLYPSLTGSKDTAYTIVLDATTLSLTGGIDISRDAPVTRSFKRGDARLDGSVTIADALFIAQYLAGLRGLGEGAYEGNTEYVAPLNAASVRHDYSASSVPGDATTIVDALYIAQMLATMRDANYEVR